MFPGQFGNANKCLRVNSVSNAYTGTFNVTGGSNPCKYFVFFCNNGTGSITWEKGIGNVQYALVGGGGAGMGPGSIVTTAGTGGNGGAVVVGQSQDPNLNGDIISVGSSNVVQNCTVGAGGTAINFLANDGGNTTWNSRTATGGLGGSEGPASASGGAGSGGAGNANGSGGIGTFVNLLLENPNASSFPTTAYNPVTGVVGTSLYSYPYYGAGGGG